MLGPGNDIYERERLFRQIAESTQEVFWIRNNDRMLYCNPAYEKVFGRQVAQIYDNPSDFLEAVHPDDLNKVITAFQTFKSEQELFDEVFRVVHPDGEVRWIHARADFIESEDGDIERSTGTATDITSTVQFEQRLRARERDLEEAQRIAHLGNWVSDFEQDVIHWSDEVFRIFGYPPQCWQPTERAFMEAVHPDDRASVREAIDASIRNPDVPYDVEHRIVRPSGQVRHVSQKGAIRVNQQGHPISMIGTVLDITERKLAELEAERLAFFDDLTGLPNRQLFRNRLNRAFAYCRRHGQCGALLLLDVERFKLVNDQYGTAFGDRVLKHLAKMFDDHTGDGDTVGRLGDDEFVILLENAGPDIERATGRVDEYAHQIAATVQDPLEVEGRQVRLTLNIGIALFCGHESSGDSVMGEADIALLRAKSEPTSTISFFQEAFHNQLRHRMSLEKQLRTAIEKEEFFLLYQPQVDDLGKVVGAEALVRWQHPQRGLLTPGQFIDMAEETGLIVPLGQWVFHLACLTLAKWSANPARSGLTISVNVSPKQFKDPNLLSQLDAAIKITGANPNRLEIEITESILIEDLEFVLGVMNAIRQRGIGLAVDDFGIGYSSLSYLKHLPLTHLKIDQSFVRAIDTSRKDLAITETIIALGDRLSLMVTAEGVETLRQMEQLKAIGCYRFQGYLHGYPVQEEDFNSG